MPALLIASPKRSLVNCIGLSRVQVLSSLTALASLFRSDPKIRVWAVPQLPKPAYFKQSITVSYSFCMISQPHHNLKIRQENARSGALKSVLPPFRNVASNNFGGTCTASVCVDSSNLNVRPIQCIK